MHFLFEAPIGLLPVVAFLALLLQFDSYKLVSLTETLRAMVAGVLLCGVAYFANDRLMGLSALDYTMYSHFIAPAVEEGLKAAFIVWLLLRNRIGFMIDAAILGFAVGTGFAVTENLYYLYAFQDANQAVWIIRGFGTAIMHGGATALFAILAQSLTDRWRRWNPLAYVPGLVAATLFHFAYNLFNATPLVAAIAVLVLLPGLLVFVFRKSQHTIHSWLLHDYETHQHLLDDIKNGTFKNSAAGSFITNLAARFSAAHAALIFEYIKLHTELVLRAEKIDLSREKGEPLPVTDADRANFKRLHALEHKIGRTAMLALWPHLHFSRKELWELNEFEQEVRAA